MKEPTRLSEGDQLPSALRGAFRALERDAPSAQTVARVQQALEALPAATPAALAVGTLSVGKVLVLVGVIAGSVVATWLGRRELFPQPVPSAASTLPVAETSVPPEPEATPTAVAGDQPAPHAPTVTLGEPASSAIAAQAERREARLSQVDVATSRGGPRTQPAVLSRAKRSHAAAQPVASAAAANEANARDELSSEENASPITDAFAASSQSATTSAAAAQASEAQLLAQAKRLAARDPESALRQVETLARKYPGGTFTQERELLAIQLHRRLGHAAIAEQLTLQFQEHYPRSVYRRALQP